MSAEKLEFTLPALVRAAIMTVANPREGALMILRQHLPRPVLWLCLLTIVVVSVIMGQGTLLLAVGEDQLVSPLLANPFFMCVTQLVLLAIMAYVIHAVGRAFKGTGSFDDSLALVVWLQVVLACLQVVQTVALFVAPVVADLLGIAGLVLFLWLLTNFVALQHGFKALAPVFVIILVTAFGLTFAFSLVLSLLGVISPGDLNV